MLDRGSSSTIQCYRQHDADLPLDDQKLVYAPSSNVISVQVVDWAALQKFDSLDSERSIIESRLDSWEKEQPAHDPLRWEHSTVV